MIASHPAYSMSKPILHVFSGSNRVGILARSNTRDVSTVFACEDGSRGSDALSLTISARQDPYEAKGRLLPVFEMNLPEGHLREYLSRRFAKSMSPFDDMALLQIVGASQIGRLRCLPPGSAISTVPTLDLDEFLAYKGSTELFPSLLERFAVHSGICGMQPKVLVRASQVTGQGGQQGATHIIKTFDTLEHPELAANELICMRGAVAAGIHTANVRISENRQFLLIDRFDLLPDGSYLGVEDFCVLQGKISHHRYDGSYEGVADWLNRVVPEPVLEVALEQYALMVAYSCAIGNGDAHLKNFAVRYSDASSVELAPAYDLVSTLAYQALDTLALELGGSKAFPDRSRLVKFMYQVAGISDAHAADLLEQVRCGVEVAILEANTLGAQCPDARPFTDHLIAVFRAGLGRLD